MSAGSSASAPLYSDPEAYICWVCGTEIGAPDGDDAEDPEYPEHVPWRTCSNCEEAAR